MRIIAIRHLRTEWNKKGWLQGRTDIELDKEDAKNHTLVEQLKKDLADFSFNRVWVSPMKRAVQSAEWLGLSEFEIDDRVQEISFGNWEGRSKDEMIETFQGRWASDPFSTELEPELRDLERRVKEVAQSLQPDDEVLIISHGAFIRALRSYLEEGSIDSMNQTYFDNGELYTFERE